MLVNKIAHFVYFYTVLCLPSMLLFVKGHFMENKAQFSSETKIAIDWKQMHSKNCHVIVT